MVQTIYKFAPILKEKIWGGTKLRYFFDKKTDSNHLGESWELSGVAGDESVVSTGFHAGDSISALIKTYKNDLVGKKVFEKFGYTFPLLFKFIDAADKLSIQVHPNDETASEKHKCFGKTEMWYVVDADKNAEVIVGFRKNTTKKECSDTIKNGQFEDLLQRMSVKKGDVFNVPAGRIHSIGKGVLLAEIQQTSDITYRVYDYKRTNEDGKERDLHIEQALDVIDFNATADSKISYLPKLNESTLLLESDYFTTNLIHFNQEIIRSYSDIDSFVVHMCIEGTFEIEINGEKTSVKKGETVLIPAIINEVKLIPDEETELLEVFATT